MAMRTVIPILFLVLCLGLALEVAYYWPYLPARLATHFDAAGVPNGWMSRSAFVLDIVMVVAVLGTAMLAVGLLAKVPDSMINLPGKAFWLAPGRREAALGFARDWTRGFMLLTMGLMVVIHGLVLQGNLEAPPRMSPLAFWFLGAYGLAAVAMLVALIWRFRVPPAERR